MRRIVRILLAVCLAEVCFAQQPAAPHARATSSSANAAAAANRPRLSDAQIDATIRMKLAKSKIGADHFKFHVQNGVVTIEGKTDVVQHKGAATRMARTSGALAVVNQIQISEAAKEKARANLESGRRRAQIKRGEAPAPRTDSRSQPPLAAGKSGTGGS